MTAAPWLVWLLPLGASPLVLLVSVIDERACRWFAATVSALTASIGIYQAISFVTPHVESIGNWLAYANILLEVRVDGLSVLLAAFVSALSFVIVLYAIENMKLEKGQARFYSLVLLFIGAMLALLMAGNLVQLYFFWEIVGICSALLIAFWTDRESARKAGVKAFVVTRFGDIALLVAVVLTLATLNTTDFSAIDSAVQSHGVDSTWTLIGILVFIGSMGKSAQVPLHAWLPDAMEGPTPVSALIHAATMVNAGVYLVVRFSPVFGASSFLSTTILIIGSLSMVVGAACACAEEDLKRILAYSTISQIGLMFVAVGVGSYSGAIYQLISQGLFKALAFMAAGSVIEAVGTRNIEAMGGLARVMKFTYVSFLVAMLSMVGLPPLFGFWAKDTILSAAINVNLYAFLVVSLASILTSLYGFRALFKVFHGPKIARARESRPLMTVPMMALVVSAICGWLVLNRQSLFQPVLGLSVNLLTSTATLVVLFAGLVASYVAFLSRREEVHDIVQSSLLLKGTRAFLVSGMGFDALYEGGRSLANPFIRLAKGIQTGVLGNNVALILSTLVLIVLLIASGVI